MAELLPSVDLSGLEPIRRILVPLDGSDLAEAVIPMAAELRDRLGAQLTLLHVLEHDPPPTIHGERHLTTVNDATAYLDAVAARFADGKAKIETHVHPNPEADVARSVAEHADEFSIDLIVIASHGRSGLRGMIYGSIAQQIIRQRKVAVLLVPVGLSEGGVAAKVESMGVLVNGTPEAEAVLPMAARFAQGMAIPVHLILAVPTLDTLPGDRAAAGRLVPATMRAILDLEQAQLTGYLGALEQGLGDAGIPAQSSLVRGDPATAALNEALRLELDMLAFTTHGRPGAGSLWTGSVGSKVVGRFPRPLLLVPSP